MMSTQCSKHAQAYNKLIIKQYLNNILCIKLVNYWDAINELNVNIKRGKRLQYCRRGELHAIQPSSLTVSPSIQEPTWIRRWINLIQMFVGILSIAIIANTWSLFRSFVRIKMYFTEHSILELQRHICHVISNFYWRTDLHLGSSPYGADASRPLLTGPQCPISREPCCFTWAGSSVSIATDYGLDGPGSNPNVDEIFRPSRPALGPTEPPVKWVPSLSRG